MLALAGALAREQRSGDRLRRGNSCQFVGQNGAQQPRARLIGSRLHRREPRKTLDNGIVGRLLGVRALLAKAADRHIDNARRDGAHGLLADAEPVGNTGAEILHNDIGAGGELQQGLTAARRLQVEHDRALVTVVVEKRGGEPCPPVTAGARRVTAVGRFDLDHVGPLIGEDHRRQRPRHIRGQVDDSVTVQWTRHAFTFSSIVTPAKAEAQGNGSNSAAPIRARGRLWVPACAGTTG